MAEDMFTDNIPNQEKMDESELNLDEIIAELLPEGEEAAEKDASGEASEDIPEFNKEAPKADSEEEDDNDEQPEEKPRHRGLITFLLLLIAAGLIAAAVYLFYSRENADPYDKKILPNITVSGLNIAGMTKSHAEQVLTDAIGSKFSITDMTVILGDETIVLSPTNTGAELNIPAVIDAAYAYGREGTPQDMHQAYLKAQDEGVKISLIPHLTLNLDYIRSAVEQVTSKNTDDYSPSGYRLEGEVPPLEADVFDESIPCQTLVLTIGTPGSDFDVDGIVDAILDAYDRREFEITIGEEFLPASPEALDIDAIHRELSIPPVEAMEDELANDVIPGSCGYTFPLEAARAQLAAAAYGDVISIPMQYDKPRQLDIRGDYPEQLGTFTTELQEDANYRHNAQLVCSLISGTVIQPGATFSMMSAIPALDETNGFRTAPLHGNCCTDQGIGGGLDQVASTLHVAAICADLGISQRITSDHVCDYTIRGTEVSVDKSWKDLKIRNPYSTPILLRARVSGDMIVIRIFGQEALNYTCSPESKEVSSANFRDVGVVVARDSGYADGDVIREGINGGSYQLFRVRKDKETGEELSRVSELYVSLQPVPRQIARFS